MPRFSVVICCADAGDTLDAACRSVAWADELVVVDSGSTDDTEAIARRHADRYEREPWRGYSGQKKFATTLCRNDWVLVLDGDEECTEELAEQLQGLDDATAERFDVFSVPRRNYIYGRHARAWDKDWQSRVIHRHRVTWPADVLHEDRKASDPSRHGKLRGAILHKRVSTRGFEDYFGGRRLDARLLPVARQMYDRGKRCHAWDLVLRPWLAFFKMFILKGGFRDGAFGLLIAQKTAVTTQLKYAALWAVQNGVAQPSNDPASKHSSSST